MINASGRALVVVNPDKHEALAIIPSKSGDHTERGEVIVVKLSVQETFAYFPDTLTFIRLP